MKSDFGKRVADSLFFRRAKNQAMELTKNPDKFAALLEKADQKARLRETGALKEVWDSLMALFRMLRAYTKGTYREIPFKTLIAVISSVIYFVMPFDLVPDVLAFFGFMDDAALIAWVVNSVKKDVDAFSAWETGAKEGDG